MKPAEAKTQKLHDTLKKNNFDRAKMLSDFAGMIIRIGFIVAATSYLIVQMQIHPWFLGMVLTATCFVFVILLYNLMHSVGLIVYYVSIEWFSENPDKPGWLSWGTAWFLTILVLLGITLVGVLIAINTPAFR